MFAKSINFCQLFLPSIFLISWMPLFNVYSAEHCSRCEKIESERAKEQAEHPQKWEYYDEKKIDEEPKVEDVKKKL